MGKGTVVAILLLASLAGCERRAQYLKEQRDGGDAQIVALCVRSEPPGATVRIDRMERTWKTPCDIADFSVQRGRHEVRLALEGYEPVVAKVSYDGSDPAWVQVKLIPSRAAKAPEAPPAKPVEEPKTVQEKPPTEAPRPAPVMIEAVAGGTRLKVVQNGGKLRIQAKTMVTDPDKPGEYFLPDVPPQKVLVEFLDPKTDMVLQSVEFAPSAAPVGVVRPPAPKDPVVPSDVDRVGEVKLVHKTYGVFVKLDPGLSLQPGEEIIVFREGREVARTKILKVTHPDDAYPDGAAQVQKEGSIKKGDEVRRSKP